MKGPTPAFLMERSHKPGLRRDLVILERIEQRILLESVDYVLRDLQSDLFGSSGPSEGSDTCIDQTHHVQF